MDPNEGNQIQQGSAVFEESHFGEDFRPLSRILRPNELFIYHHNQNAILPWNIAQQRPFLYKQPIKQLKATAQSTKISRNFRSRVEISRKEIKEKNQQEKSLEWTITNNFMQFKVDRHDKASSNKKIQKLSTNSMQQREVFTSLARKRAQNRFNTLNRNGNSWKKNPKIQFLQRKFKIKYTPTAFKIKKQRSLLKSPDNIQGSYFYTIDNRKQDKQRPLNSSLVVKANLSVNLYPQIRRGTTLKLRKQHYRQ